MFVIPRDIDDDENSRRRRPVPYSQTLDQLLEADTIKSAAAFDSSSEKNLIRDKATNGQTGGVALSREPTPLAASLRQMGRPSTRHGSRSGSSAANTVGSASSTSDSSSSASSSTSSSSNSHGYGNSLHSVSERQMHSPNSESQSTSSRIDSSGQASINVWSREDDNDYEKNSGRESETADKTCANLSAASEEESFSKKLLELANRSMKIRNSNDVGSSSENQDKTILSPQRRSLTKVPSVIFERNESSDAASNRSHASAASNTAVSPSTNTSRKSSRQSPTTSLPKTNDSPDTEENHIATPNFELIAESLQQLSPGDGLDQEIERQTLPPCLTSEMDADKIKTSDEEKNENNIASIRRKWQQADQQAARQTLNNTSEYPMPLTRSKTITTTSVKRQIFNETSELTLKQAENEISKSDSTIKVASFVSRFASGVMTGSSLPASSSSSKAQTLAKTTTITKSTTAQPQQQRRITMETRSTRSSYVARGSSVPKNSKNGPTEDVNTPFESRITSQGCAQSSSGFELWVKQKIESEQERRRKLEEEKAEEEQRKLEKKREAERCFERWKADRDRALAAQRQKKEATQRNRELKALAAKEEKRRNAERTFEHWKRSHMETLERQRTRSASAEKRRAASASKQETTKKEEAERAYFVWLREKEKKQRNMEAQKREFERQEKERKKLEAEYKQQLSKEAYELWLQLKQEEYKYSKSLAYKILEFESEAKRRWPSTPWLPTGNTVARRFVGSGHRRKTLERPLHLKHSRSRARSLH